MALLKNLATETVSGIMEKTLSTRESNKNIKSISETITEVLEDIWRRITDTTPLLPNFPKSLLTELYVARTILFASFTLGIRVGGLPVVHYPIREVFGYVIVFLFTYWFVPSFGFGAASLFTKGKLTVFEFRAIMIIWAFLCGVFSMVANIHYSLVAMGPPTYFMPVVVGLMVQGIGNRFDNDRKMLVGVCVGSAIALSISILLMTGENITFSCAFSLVLCAINAVVSLQLMIYDLMKDGDKVNPSITHAVGIFLVMLNFLLVTRLTGHYTPDPSQNDVARGAPLHSALTA